MEDSHARTLALQDAEKAWKESEAAYFSRSCAWPKKSSPSSYSLRMCLLSAHAGVSELQGKLPRWGMTVDGALFPLMSSSIKKETGGFYLPNLVACDSRKGPAKEYNRSGTQASMRNIVTISYRIWKVGRLMPEVCEKMMGYPKGWTELEPLETQSCQPKLEKLFASCRDINEKKNTNHTDSDRKSRTSQLDMG